MEDWVFVDTCIWSSFFGKPSSPEKGAVDALLDADRVALVGPVVSEVLLGFRRKDQADWVVSRLRLAHYVEANWDDWRPPQTWAHEVAAKGNRLPLTDLVVATVVKRCLAWVYTSDPHFDCLHDLKRFWPT